MYQLVIFTGDEAGSPFEIKRTDSEHQLGLVLERCEKRKQGLIVFTRGKYYDRDTARSHLLPLAA